MHVLMTVDTYPCVMIPIRIHITFDDFHDDSMIPICSIDKSLPPSLVLLGETLRPQLTSSASRRVQYDSKATAFLLHLGQAEIHTLVLLGEFLRPQHTV